MPWTPPPLDPIPYGPDLAARVASYLEQGHSIGYGHRDYCGMGLETCEGKFCYAELNDGRMCPLEDLLADTSGLTRIFHDRASFIAWLAAQSDVTLARLEDPNDFYHRNQTIDRERIEEFLRVRDAVPKLTQGRWKKLCRSMPASKELFDRYFLLFSAYSEEHRHYHNLRHLNECLAEFDTITHLARNPAALETALWFHAIIYDPKITDNEERSAKWAKNLLSEADAPKAFIGHVRSLILITKTHQPDATPDSDLICDIDLAILGQDEARFQEYEAAIREEYAHVPDDIFNPKRAEILQRFLDCPHIYHTDSFRTRYEFPARHNLQQSIQSLTASSRRGCLGLL
ncbi:MAG TPA: hypothetical protein VD994_03160 [Prosthecobacter sp.]|nr:hypothetical protein [Prosthecobacter sp.]